MSADELDVQLARQQADREAQIAANERHLARGGLSAGEVARLESSTAQLRAEVARIVNARQGR
jgi:hypothetical protein